MTISGRVTGLVSWVALLATVVAAIVCVAWLIGRIVSDRYGWSQWLLWIPTPVVLLTVATALGLGCMRDDVPGRRRRRLIAWGVTGGVVLALVVGGVGWRFRGSAALT